MELVIGLLISSIVVGMVYYGLFVFNRQWISYQKKSAGETDFLLFKSTLGRDIEEAAVITDTLDKKGINIITKDDVRLGYRTGDGYIVRMSGEALDTFYNKVAITDVQYVSDSVPLVKKISLHLLVDGEIVPLSYYKEYASSELMSAETIPSQ